MRYRSGSRLRILFSTTPEKRTKNKQEAFEKCWAHSPQLTSRLTPIHHLSLEVLSRAACASMSTPTTTTTTRDRGPNDRDRPTDTDTGNCPVEVGCSSKQLTQLGGVAALMGLYTCPSQLQPEDSIITHFTCDVYTVQHFSRTYRSLYVKNSKIKDNSLDTGTVVVHNRQPSPTTMPQKSTTASITAEHGSFNRLRQVAPMCTRV